MDTLDSALAALSRLPSRPDSAAAQAAFRHARAAYKRIEYRLEFEDGNLGGVLNGPPLPAVDEDDPESVLSPTGLQVIEGALFPRPLPNAPQIIDPQVKMMRLVLRRVRADPPDTTDLWRRAFDMARLEVARVATLGIAGFDATRSGDGLRESAEALRGVRDCLQVYRETMLTRDPTGWNALELALGATIADLEAAPNFENFDRLEFLTRFVRPLTEELGRLEARLQLAPPKRPTPWSPGGTYVYASAALSRAFFAPDFAPPSTPRLVALGERLFFDSSLSLRRNRSCATCHQPARAFADGRARAAVDPGPGAVRNTPTVLHAGMQAALFADQRAPFLEFQADVVLRNPREMGLPLPSAVERLGADPGVRTQFASAFGLPGPKAVTGRTLMVAIAAYVRSLGRMDSRFDRAVNGDATALTAAERRGFNRFMGKAACATCHFPPLFNGTQPPSFRQSEPEVIGVPVRPLDQPPALDPDLGVSAVTRAALHRHAFKTPSLRNVAVTGPYMHNGVFRTLDEVMEFYDRGGGEGIGLHVANQTLSPEPLRLTDQEKRDLVAFLRSLTDFRYEAPALASH